MTVSFAPLEGISGWVYRLAHHDSFPGVDRYHAPFWAPTADSPLTGRGLRDVLPEHNAGIELVPQLLTNRAEDFLSAARALQDLGYRRVDLNLGCPSGTVVAKRKGSGFLALPDELDAFLDTVFSARLDLAVTVKTRIGLEDEGEWPRLLAIYDRYPIAELTIHPRLRSDFYKGPVRREAFRYAVAHTRLPLCYNGDLFTVEDCRAFAEEFPTVRHIMLGRGLVADPSLARQLAGGPPLGRDELRAFHDRLLADYRRVLSGDRPVLGKLKELWDYLGCHFPESDRARKAMRKARTLADYERAVDALFREGPFVSAARFTPGV